MVRSNIALSEPKQSHSRSEDRSRAMTWRTKLAAGAGAAFLALTGAGAASADEPPYPVWWSPVLELESLDAIDARLKRAFSSNDPAGLRLTKTEADTTIEVWASNCSALAMLTEAGLKVWEARAERSSFPIWLIAAPSPYLDSPRQPRKAICVAFS